MDWAGQLWMTRGIAQTQVYSLLGLLVFATGHVKIDLWAGEMCLLS